MKSRTFTPLILLVILLPFMINPSLATSPLLNATQSSAESNSGGFSKSPSFPSGSPPLPSPDYSDIGIARSTAEYANRTDAGQYLYLTYDSTSGVRTNDTAEAVLPPGWEGYMLYTYVYQIAENRCWVLNPEFNNSAQYWNNITFDGGSWTNVITNYYRADGHGTGNSAVECYIDGFDRGGGWYSYDPQDYARWNQTIAVPPRGQVLSASISFDYWVWTDSVWGLGLPFQIYARVEGQSVHSVGFDNVLVAEQTWTNTGVQSFSPGIIDLSDGLNVQVGLRYTGGSSTRFSPDPQPHARFDNVFLYITTLVKPSDINLTMNGLDVVDIDFGIGRVADNQTGMPWTTTPVIAYFNWTSKPFPPDPDMDMDVTLNVDTNLFSRKFSSTLYNQHPSHVGTLFEAVSGQNTSWTMYYQLALPSQYGNDHFNFTIPVDWNVTFVSEPQLPTTNKVDQCIGGHLGDGYLSIPASNITNSPDGYWCIMAESHNYVDSAELQIGDGIWSTTAAVRAGNVTRVRARILDGSNNPPSDVTSTQANVSIYNPDGVTVWFTQLINPNSSGWVITNNITIDGSTTIGGIYTVVVFWSNTTEAGELQSTYSVTHSTTLVPREPIIYTFFEDQPLYPKVRFNDTDKHVWLSPPATVEGNWTTGTITFYWIAGTGYYEAEINALDVPDVGWFRIRVNASKSYYDDAYCYILIDVSSETQVYSPQAPTTTVPWKDNVTIEVQYKRKTDGVGVNGCIPYVEVLANWTVGYYTINEVGNGWYNIELNSTGKVLGTYALNITIYKERYQRQQFYITVTVRARNTQFTYTPPTSTPYEENATIEIFTNDLDNGGAAITNATGQLHIRVFNGTIQWFSSGDYFWISVTGSGIFEIMVNTSYLPGVGGYSFTIYFDWYGQPYFANRSISVIVTVRQFNTIVNYDSPAPTPWDENASITFYFLVDDIQSSKHNGDPIGTATITATLNGIPLVYNVNFTYTEVAIGQYEITIFNTVLGTIGSYSLKVTFVYPTQPNPAHNFYKSASRTISFSVRRLYTNLTYTPPESTPFGDNVSITITYLVNDPDSSHHGEGILPTVTITVANVGGIYVIGPGDFSYIHLGGGQYQITIFSSALPAILTYNISIHISESSTGRYDDANISKMSFIVRTVYTAFERDPFDAVGWGLNVTIVTYYTVSDAGSSQNGFPITGAPIYVVGIGWTLTSGNYTIVETGPGIYTITINTSGVPNPGSWQIQITIDWPASPPTYQERYLIVSLVVNNRETSLTPSYVPSADYGAYINATLTFYDVDGLRNIDNSTFGPYVSFSVLNASDNNPIPAGTWNVTALFDGTYLILINTSYFGRVNVYHSFIIKVFWDAGNLPFYENASTTITVYVVGTKTTVIYTPPEPQPYGDDLIFIIKYNMTEAPHSPVGNSSGYVYINATCTSHVFTLIYTVEMINNGLGGYRLIIDTSNFPGLGQYTFKVYVVWPTDVAPYYESQMVLMSGYVRAIHTSMSWELPGSLYWGDTLYFLATFHDDDHNVYLSDITNTTVICWLDWAGWTIVEIFPNGTYRIQVPTGSENVGLANFTLRFSSTFYETREQLVQFTIYSLPLYVQIISTSPWEVGYNGTVVLTVRVTDYYGRLINDSNTVYHWIGHPEASMAFIGAGVYNVTFFADYDSGTHLVTVEGRKTNCVTGYGILALNILKVDSILDILEPTIYVVAGDVFVISVNYTTIDGSYLPTADVTYSWAGGDGSLIYVGGGRFNATLDSTGFTFGQYLVTISASSPNVFERYGVITIRITVKPAALEPDSSVINVYWGENFTLLVFLHDTHYDLPINGALVQYQWGTLNGTLQFIGAGWYNISLSSTIFNVGIYQATLTASPVGYQYTITSVTINILAQPTQLTLTQAEAHLDQAGFITELGLTGWTVPRGDVLWLYFNFTDSSNSTILGATGYYTWELGSGILEFVNGFYIAKINLTDVSPSTYFLTITLSRQNFVVNQKTQMQLIVIPIPTAIEDVGDTLSVYTGDSFDITLSFTDTWHGLPITDAYITLSIPELAIFDAELEDNGDGTYSIYDLSIPREGTFTIQITAQGAARFDQAQHSMTVFVSLHPFVQYTFQLGLIVALLGILILGAWLAWSRIFSIPWLVRKMRKMSKTIGRGKVPSLSGRDIDRIATRADSMAVIAEPVYDSVGLAVPAAVIPAIVAFEEREAEDEVLWSELEQLEGLGVDQKLELFEEMKRIPPRDRVWFLEDLKRQMADGTRFGRPPAPPKEELEVPPGVEPDLIKRLDAISAMTPEEKAAVVEQLKGLPKKEQEEVIRALEETKG
jgi:hypothetical protein